MLALAPCDSDTTGSTTTLQTVRKPIAELKGTALVWDCVDNPGDITNAKGCIFCGLKFPGGPSRIGEHLLAHPGKHVKVCKPDPIWLQRYKEVVAELRRRALVAQKMLSRSQTFAVIRVELQSNGCKQRVPVIGLQL